MLHPRAKGLLRGIVLTAAIGAALPLLRSAAADQLLTGTAAYGDWTSDAPGVRRLITAADLPSPNATPSARNSPEVGRRPAAAALRVPPGFHVAVFAGGFDEPREMKTAPNGDVFLAESGAGRIRILRARNGAAQPEGEAAVFASGLDRPFGMAFYPPGANPQYLYVADTNRLLRFPYRSGDLKASGPPQTIIPTIPTGGHWTRDVVVAPDGRKIYVSVGSAGNIGPNVPGRAAITELNPDGSGRRILASGLRNPVAMAFFPGSSALWTSVNERDGIGDDLPPDYATRVHDGAFYGWPWFYIGAHRDARVPDPPAGLSDRVTVPDVLFQPHSAPLGIAFYTGQQFPAAYRDNLFVALHGSWNRSKRTGYKIVRIPMRDGKASGEYDDFLTGFVVSGSEVSGRPVGLTTAADGALLVSDDGTGTIWRVSYAGTAGH